MPEVVSDEPSRPGELRDRAGAGVEELAAAVAFLTRIPVPGLVGGRERTGAAAFGLVGLLLGAAAAVPLAVLGAGHPLIAAVAAVAVLQVLAGAFHLDGLADTADALAAPGGRADAARTDPRAGTAGVTAIAVALGLDAAALAELAGRDPLLAASAVVAAVVASRATAPVWAVVVGRARSPRHGLGAWFSGATTVGDAAVAVLSLLVAGLVLVEVTGPRVLIATATGLGVAALVGGAIVRLRRQLDGDGHGAIIEVTVTAVLVASALVG
jgi:adenosylcobinamide-GDP ribazoletransferase